jgi:hypothetical protein
MRRTRDPKVAEGEEQVLSPAPREAPHAILALQQSAGNAAVARWLARQPTVTTPAAQSADYDAARAERDTFVQAGKKGPVTYNPSDRNADNYYGGFDVAYDPGSQALDVIVKGAIEYLPGMILKSGLAEAKEKSTEAATAADVINALPAADRPAEVKKWQWSKAGGPDADDEKTFLADFKSQVTTMWSGKHAFHCSKKYWEDLGAETKVDVQVTEGAKGAADHMKMNIFKIPKAMNVTKANVGRTDKPKGAFGNTLTMNSSGTQTKAFNKLVRDIGFDPGTNTLTTAAKAELTKLGGEMPNAPADATIAADDVTAKVPGADDAARQARFTAVRDALTATGMSPGRVKFEAAGTGDGGTVMVGDGRNRSSAAHEMGHMFGLDDEYPGTGKYAAGQKTEHTDFVDKAGFKGAQHARSDSIMSSGANVRPHHYATFLDALKIVSGMNEWEYGKPRLVVDPAKIGDYPLGGPGGTAPATPPDTRLA